MSLSAVSSSDPYALYRQRNLDFQTLSAAIKSGNTSAAQKALKSYQTDLQSLGASDSTGSTSDTSQSNPYASTIKTDLTTLSSAVQSGDMTGAQSALKTYAQDYADFGDGSDSSADPMSSFVKDLTSLVSSVSSGDSSGTQSSAASLVNDLVNLFQGGGTEKSHGHHHGHHGGPPPGGPPPGGPPPGGGPNGSTAASGATSSSGTTSANSDDPLSQIVDQLAAFLKQLTQGTSTASTTSTTATV